jgi:hypothetical protein
MVLALRARNLCAAPVVARPRCTTTLMQPSVVACYSSSPLNAGDALTNIVSRLIDAVVVDRDPRPDRSAAESARHCLGYVIDTVPLAAQPACS